MAQQTINIGQAPNDRKGDKARDAFRKINENFTELFAGGTKMKKCVVTAAEFANCFTSPVILLDNPGVGKFNMVHTFAARWEPGATVWSNELLRILTGAFPVRQLSSFLSTPNELWQMHGLGNATSGVLPLPFNQPTVLTTLGTNNPTGGVGGTLTLWLFYTVVDL